MDVTNYGTADIIVKDFSRLPLKADTFNSDAIIASLNYFENPSSVLSECVKVLKPNGILAITMINPILGKIWHSLREKWAFHPGLSYQQLKAFMSGMPIQIMKKQKFMFGLNHLYIFIKNE